MLRRCSLVKSETGSVAVTESDGSEGETRERINGLDGVINPSGSLSAGERQLTAMARAILRKSKVVIMDEATSQIDVTLDDKVNIFGFQVLPLHLDFLNRFNGRFEKKWLTQW